MMQSDQPAIQSLPGSQRKSHIRREFLPNILPCCNQLCPLLNKSVGSPGVLVGDISGHREDLPILLQGTTRCNSGTAIFSRLDHQDAQRNPADNSVPNWKVLRRGKSAQREFGYERPSQAENLV